MNEYIYTHHLFDQEEQDNSKQILSV